jgi:hypothetical protein
MDQCACVFVQDSGIESKVNVWGLQTCVPFSRTPPLFHQNL